MSTTYVRVTFRNDADAVFDPTSIVLSDPTATYGIKRNDNDAVVVADGTAVTKISTGIYEKSFTDPAAGLTYTAYFEYVIGGETYWTPKIVTGAPDAANDLSLAASEMVDRLEDFMGWSSPTATQSAWALKRLNDGYSRALRGEHYDPSTGELAYHDWNFLKPIAQLSIGGATTGTATVATAGTATATTAIFDESMVGLTMTVTDYDGALTDLEVDITGYTSTTVVTVDDDTNTWAAKAISVPSTGIYDLPALFGGLLEPMGYHYSSSGQSDIVEVTPEEIQERWRQSKSLGIPDKYAIVPKTFTTATGQRFQAWFNSLPSAAMVIRYRYRLLQAPLTDAAVYPVGGPDFNRLVLVAGLAACEHAKSVRDGTNESIYQGTVQALIKLDRSAFSAGDAPERLINEGLEA